MTVSYPIKIEQPAIANALLRHHLFDMIDEMRASPIVWIAGPGGAGKTTLLSSYVASRDIPCIWYRVDSSDNDPASFFYYLGLAAQKAAPRKTVSLPHFTPEYHLGMEDFSRYFFTEFYRLLKPGSCILFDNCNEIDDETDLFRAAVAGLPRMLPDMNLIFISRRQPPAALGHYAINGELGRLDWDDLRLSADEFITLSKRYGLQLDEDKIRHLHALLDGWVAGLHLLCRAGPLKEPVALSDDQMEKHSREILFEYFASEVFQTLDQECQDILLKTSILPYVDKEMAEVTCNSSNAFNILKRVFKANIFMHRHGRSPTTYRYHTLFREFLLDHCRRKIPKKTINALYGSSAEKLLERGQTEEAAKLLIRSCHWRKLSSLILAEAPVLLQQGRFITLADWLDRIPEKEKHDQPWLLYWRAMCMMLQQPLSAWQHFQNTLTAFEQSNDIEGIFLTMSGMGESLAYSFDTFFFYDQWIAKLEQLMTATDFPNPTIEAKITSILISAITMRRPSHPKADQWLRRARVLLEQAEIDASLLHIQLLNTLILYYISTGNLSEAALLLDSFKAIAEKPEMSPLPVLLLKNFEALYYWRTGLSQKCKTAVDAALSLAKETGIHIFRAILLTNGASGALSDGDINRAQDYLDEIEIQYATSGRYIRQLYHILKAWKSLLENEHSKAIAHAQQSVQYGRESGNPEATAVSHLVLAMAYHQAGKREKALRSGEEALKISHHNLCHQIEFGCLMFLAEWNLDTGKENEGLKTLQEALSTGAAHGYFCFPLWRSESVAKLCKLALQKDMETAYVKKLIVHRGLSRSTPPVTVKNWPWALHIYCFGRFALVSNRQTLTTGGNAQQKPLSLLKLLLSEGGRNVPVTSFTNTLWPDADGDMQIQTFNTTLHRLRRLLGVNKAIRLQAGEVTLDNRSCWVDVWAFERLVQHVEFPPAEGKKMPSDTTSAIEAINLYQGPFLASESAGWAVPKREILHGKFVRLIEQMGEKYINESNWAEAIAWYRRGIESAPLVEDFYHQLMACYHNSNHPVEALRIYEQYRKTLTSSLGMQPSPPIELLRQTILKSR